MTSIQWAWRLFSVVIGAAAGATLLSQSECAPSAPTQIADVYVDGGLPNQILELKCKGLRCY